HPAGRSGGPPARRSSSRIRSERSRGRSRQPSSRRHATLLLSWTDRLTTCGRPEKSGLYVGADGESSALLRLLGRGLQARWTQYLLTAVAVAIGVALVSGTILLAQSARASYSKLLHQVSSGIDLYVRGPETEVHQGISDFAPVPDALLARVRAVPGVAEARGQVVRTGHLVSTSGTFLDVDRPTYVYSW